MRATSSRSWRRARRRRHDERRKQRDAGLWKRLERQSEDERVGDDGIRRRLVDDRLVAARIRVDEVLLPAGLEP
jgi:hypothetical protein